MFARTPVRIILDKIEKDSRMTQVLKISSNHAYSHRMIIIFMVLWHLFVFLTGNLYGQVPNFRFERISLKQGLSQSTVTSIIQDHKGFLWFGTEDGLNRYDGYGFKIYKHDETDPGSISTNYVNVLYIDSKNTLWIGYHHGGMDKYVIEQDQFKHYKHNPNDDNSLSGNKVNAIYEDQAGVLWIATDSGLNRFDRDKGVFKRYKNNRDNPFSLSNDEVKAVCEDSSGLLWVGTKHGLNQFDRKNETFTVYTVNPTDVHSLSDNYIKVLYEDSLRNLWIGTENGGVNKYIKDKNHFVRYRAEKEKANSLSHETIRTIFEDSTGLLWIGTEEGLNMFDPGQGVIRILKKNKTDQESLSDNFILSIYEDRSGILWFGTSQYGINKLDRKKQRFAHLKHNPDNANSLSDNFIKAIYEDKSGIVWIGANQGLTRYDPNQNRFTIYKHNPNDPQSLSSNRIRAIVEDRSGLLWIGTVRGGLNSLNKTTGHFTRYSFDLNKPKSIFKHIACIIEDKQGMMWVGTFQQGVYKFDRQMTVLIHYKHDPDNDHSISGHYVYVIYEDSIGDIWLGTESGLNKYNRSTDKFEVYRYSLSDKQSISNNHILSIYEDISGRLWIGTKGGGLNLFVRQKNSFIHYTEKNGLANNTIYGILEDNQGNIWMSTNKGLCKMDPEKKLFKNYDIEDGLQSNEFNGGAYYKSENGKMYFGGVNGLSCFYADKIKDNDYIPPIVLTSFKKFGQEVQLDKLISERQELELQWYDNMISFDFVALDFTNSNKNQYKYKLSGFDRDWIEAGTNNRAIYTNLDGGDYVLTIKGSNNDGIWNETGLSLKIKVSSPPWRTWRAYGIYCFCLLGVVLGIIHLRTGTQKRKLEYKIKELENERKLSQRLKEIDKLKDEFLANTSHELKTPLNGMIGISESMFDGSLGQINPKQRQHLDMVISSGKRLFNLINDILDFSRLKYKDIEIKAVAVDLYAMTEMTLLLSRPLVGSKSLQLLNSVPSDIPPVDADENRLSQIMINLIANAIKFSNTGTIEVKARVVNRDVEIMVSDDGIGIAATRLAGIFESFEQADGSTGREYGGTGLGLSISKKLVEIQGGQILAKSTLGKGSDFIFTLPVSNGSVQQHSEISTVIEADILNHIEESQAEAKEILLRSDFHFQILVVDDDPVNLMVAANHLTFKNCEIIRAKNGNEALEIIKGNNSLNLVLLDVMMPKITGYEVCQQIRQSYSPTELPVILLTAKNLVSDLEKGFDVGANDYIAKPYSKNELLSRVKLHLNLAYYYSVLRQLSNNLEKLVQERTTELKESEERYRLLVELSPDAITLHSEGKILFINRAGADLLGLSHPKELLGKSIESFLPKDYHQAMTERIQIMRSKKTKAPPLEQKLIKSDDSLVDVSNASSHFIYQGKDAYLTVSRDISEQKRIERLREDTERMVKHDVNNPLICIMSQTDFYLSRPKSELSIEKLLKGIVQINHNSYKVFQLLKQSIDFYKMEQGIYQYQPEYFDIILLLKELDEMLKPVRNMNSVSIVYQLMDKVINWEESHNILGERVYLECLFSNLIKNAIEASPENATVTISLSTGEVYTIDIHNFGIIPEPVQETFFERYATYGKKKGVGLGTYSANLIAKVHRGNIRFSTSEQHGTHVIVTLPK